MGGNDLKRAAKLFRAKKYSRVLQLLEPQVFRYRESFRFFHLLGMSCLHTGDFGGAYSYLQRAVSIKPADIPSLLGIAVVHLRRQETAEALRIWFQVLDDDHNNAYANRGLKLLKRNVDTDKFIELTESEKIKNLVPSQRNFTPLIAGIAVSVCILAAVILYPIIGGFVENRLHPKRSEISRLDLDIQESYVNDNAENPRYRIDEKELKKNYTQIIALFHDYKDNLARREINRLLLSNASKELKGKLLLLEGHIRTPSFSSLGTNFPYGEVAEDPLLYEKCYVIWKGRVSNLRVESDAIRFDFLVGYETGRIVEGIVPVTVPFAVDIDPAYPIEILGQVKLRNNGILLQAESVHQFSHAEEE